MSKNAIVFLDTEFTDLINNPRLLSVGIVVGGSGVGPDLEFYAEVTDPGRLAASSNFVQDTVLPQFKVIFGAACTYADIGSRISAFLFSLAVSLPPDGIIEVAYDFNLDWELVEKAIRDTGNDDWSTLRQFLRPVNISNVTGTLIGEIAAQDYFESQYLAPIYRHHALCDARALRIAYDAVKASIIDGKNRI